MTQRNNRTRPFRKTLGLFILGAGFVFPAQADDWGFSLNLPFYRVRPNNGYYYYNNEPNYSYPNYGRYDRHNRRYYYYPRRYNPVEEREVEYREGYDRYGRRHSESTTEDRHRSFYSPGRNEAITEPETRVYREGGPGYDREVERTEWIGADGRPHSTTIDRTTTRDRFGQTHTDTDVTLKRRQDGTQLETEQKPDKSGAKRR